MAVRRALLMAAVVVAVLVLFLPGVARGAAWLDPEPHDPAATSSAPDVTTYADRSVAVWIGADHQVYAADRPRGGPWDAPDALETAGPAFDEAPKVVALPDGELVAAWVLDSGRPGFPGPGLVRAA